MLVSFTIVWDEVISCDDRHFIVASSGRSIWITIEILELGKFFISVQATQRIHSLSPSIRGIVHSVHVKFLCMNH